jgi:crotonobetaine/carnitine-CoA ligase
VLESAATGVLSELDDEDVRIFIVFRPGLLHSHEEIIAWCSDRMPAKQVPRYIEIVEELPKTTIGGIRKYELRKRPVPQHSPFES